MVLNWSVCVGVCLFAGADGAMTPPCSACGTCRVLRGREEAKDGKEGMGPLPGHLNSYALWLPGSFRLHSPQRLLTVLRGDLCVCLQDRQVIVLGGRGRFILYRSVNFNCQLFIN